MRKLIILIQLFIRIIVRRAVWISLLSFGLIFTIFCFLYVYGNEPFLALNETVYGQAVLTLVFMMMGIELLREQRRENLDDIFAAYSKSPALIPCAQVLVLGFIAAIVTLIITAGCYIRMAMDGAPALWIGQSLGYAVLLYFLPCWVLGVWGLLISKWNKGKSVYLPAMLVWFFTSSLCAYLIYYIEAAGFSSGGFLLNAFNMGINNFHVPGNIMTGSPIEMPRWIVRVGILTLLTALFLCDNPRRFASTSKKNKWAWIRAASVIVWGFALIAFFYLSFSVFFTRFADPAAV